MRNTNTMGQGEGVVRHAGLSRLRLLATLGVIWLHTCSTLSSNMALFGLSEEQGLFYRTAYRLTDWAVPVFFMLTGALLLGRGLSYREVLTRHVRRILLALLLFGVPFAAVKLVVENDMALGAWSGAFRAVLENEGLAHMWYLYALVGLYLVMPALDRVAGMPRGEQRILLLALLLLNFLLPAVNTLTGLRIAFDTPMTYLVFYVLLGHYLHAFRPRIRWKPVWAAACFAVIVAVNLADFHASELTFYDSPVIALLAAVLFSGFDMRDGAANAALWGLDRLCFGAYLVHPMYIQFAYRVLGLYPSGMKAYPAATLAFFAAVALISFATSWVLRRIGPLRKYVL